MSMLSLSCAILCRGMRARDTMRDALFYKVLAECLEFTTKIRLEVDDFLTDLSLHVALKVNKDLEHITLQF